MAVIGEAIDILIDDDALDVFKKASAFLQKAPVGAVGFLQAKYTKASKLSKAHALIASHAVEGRMLPCPMWVPMKLKSKVQNFHMIMARSTTC